MKYLKWSALILALSLLSCKQAEKAKASEIDTGTVKKVLSVEQTVNPDSSYNEKDKEEIQLLIRHVLAWAESKNGFELTPVLTDSQDTLCIGFDLEKVKANLGVLRSTDYFSSEFIDNYNQILLTLDKEMKDHQFAPWSTGELPPFNFANDVDPWCDCQDVPYDEPNAYGLVEIHVVNLNKEEGKLYWTWGKLSPETDKGWREFTYKFRVKKEDGKWKVAYLQGFDYNEGIKV